MSKQLCRYFGEPCIEHECHHYINVVGKDPTTGELINNFMCSELALIKVTIENTKAQRETGAEVLELRKVVDNAQVPETQVVYVSGPEAGYPELLMNGVKDVPSS